MEMFQKGLWCLLASIAVFFSIPSTGGIRGVGFVHSPLLSTKGRVSMDLMHVTDWLPTLYSAAGGDIHNLTKIDGFDMWQTLLSGSTDSPRAEILHNIDPVTGAAAYRFGKWKLIANISKHLWNYGLLLLVSFSLGLSLHFMEQTSFLDRHEKYMETETKASVA